MQKLRMYSVHDTFIYMYLEFIIIILLYNVNIKCYHIIIIQLTLFIDINNLILIAFYNNINVYIISTIYHY